MEKILVPTSESHCGINVYKMLRTEIAQYKHSINIIVAALCSSKDTMYVKYIYHIHVSVLKKHK